MADSDKLVKELTPYLSKMSLEAILKQRDKYIVGSFKWNIYNTVKALKQLMVKPSYSEKVMVIQDNKLDTNFSEFTPYDKRLSTFLEQECSPMIRSMAEYYPGFRQIVTNAIVCYKGQQYLVLQRTNKFNDGRLQGYIGLPGGHMNHMDGSIFIGLLRELQEELHGIDVMSARVTPIGFIRNMNGNKAISKEHLCCLFKVDVDNLNISSNTSGEVSHWYTKEAIESMLSEDANQLDNWACIAFENMFRMEL